MNKAGYDIEKTSNSENLTVTKCSAQAIRKKQLSKNLSALQHTSIELSMICQPQLLLLHHRLLCFIYCVCSFSVDIKVVSTTHVASFPFIKPWITQHYKLQLCQVNICFKQHNTIVQCYQFSLDLTRLLIHRNQSFLRSAIIQIVMIHKTWCMIKLITNFIVLTFLYILQNQIIILV